MKRAVRAGVQSLFFGIFGILERIVQRINSFQRSMDEIPYKHNICLVGGTFDRFHSGHKLLLESGLRDSKKLMIYVTNDQLAQGKSPLVQSYEDRVASIWEWVDESGHEPSRFFVGSLNDNFGPAPDMEDAGAILATPETEVGCVQINQMRVNNGFQELEIIMVPHLLDANNGIISSSRIRAGLIDQDGNMWLDDDWYNHDLVMTDMVLDELKNPMGELFEGPENLPEVAMQKALDSFSGPQAMLIAVGDVTVKTLLDLKFTPDIALIDGVTKREELPDSEQVETSVFANVIHANNPAGRLTPELGDAIAEAMGEDESTVIVVEGEEDLAPLLVHLMAPITSTVIYGQPKVGVVVQHTSLEVKERCRNILSCFEVE